MIWLLLTCLVLAYNNWLKYAHNMVWSRVRKHSNHSFLLSLLLLGEKEEKKPSTDIKTSTISVKCAKHCAWTLMHFVHFQLLIYVNIVYYRHIYTYHMLILLSSYFVVTSYIKIRHFQPISFNVNSVMVTNTHNQRYLHDSSKISSFVWEGWDVVQFIPPIRPFIIY